MYQVGTINFSFALMLSKAQNKYIRSLSQQKYRKEYDVFIAEGDKIAKEWLNSSAKIEKVVGLESWLEANKQLINKHPEAEVIEAREQDLEAITTLQTPNQALLVVKMQHHGLPTETTGWNLALEDIQDPGNMGTLIRIADWFGIDYIYCSAGCVDVYNPKVVQSAMGGHLRVKIVIADLNDIVNQKGTVAYAATLDGGNVYEATNMAPGILMIGNESKGLSKSLADKATQKLMIPRRGGAESLNAAVSAGILCALLIRS
jgi:TrmH family RNA methyltransferase